MQAFSSLQVTADPTHRPSLLQVSCVVHASPSLQLAPGVGVKTHSPLTHASLVQAFSSSHDRGLPAQTPSTLQVSSVVQASPSSQASPGVGV